MGSQSFIPGGMIATAAQAAAAGMRGRRTGSRRRKRAKSKRKSAPKRASGRRSSRSRKPRPGTKAWMAYIRGMRGKKKR